MGTPEGRREQLVELHGRGLREHAARGTLINTAFTVGLNFLTLLRGFLLAVFLTAADYGVWGILVVSLGTILWLKQVGIGDKYIQQDDQDQEQAFQKAFTLELIVTGAFMALLLAAVPLIALVYGEPKLLLPGLALVLVMPAGALQAPLWVYYRNMDFLRQRLLQAVEPVVGFVVAIAMAIAGAGYWAMAGGILAGAWCGALMAVAFSPYKLRLRFDRSTTRKYASFSWPLFVSGAASMVIAQSAVLASEWQLGLAGAGIITLASQVTSFVRRVDGLVTGTLYPAICAVKDRVALLEESFVKSNRMALMWAMPAGTGLALFCDDLVDYVLGQKWSDAVLILQVTGLTAAIGHIGFNWDAYFRARGETKPMAVASVGAMVAFLAVGLPLLFTYDLRGLALGIAFQVAVHMAFRAYYLRRMFHGFTFVRHAMRAMLPTVPAAGVVLLVRLVETGPRSGLDAVLELALYGVVTVIATWVFERQLLRESVGYLRGRGPSPLATPAA